MRIGSVAVMLCLGGCDREVSLVQIVAGDADDYEVVAAPRGTLDDLDAVAGPLLTFTASADIVTAFGDVLPRDGGFDAANYVSGALEPRTDWGVRDGTAIAQDFDTLSLFTAHARLEQILLDFAALGAREEAVGALVVHYDPSGLGLEGAAYLNTADALLLLRPAGYESLPIALNYGVLAHEVGHRVQYWELWDGAYYETLGSKATTLSDAVTYYHLIGLGEGLSDYHGAVMSGDPGFYERSFAFDTAGARELTVAKVLDPAWLRADTYTGDAGNTVDPHIEGAVIAAALWEVGEDIGHEEVSRAVVDAQRNLAPAVRELDYVLGDYEAEVVRLLGPAACPPFLTAFALVADRFDEVCP